jgi:hypothetical protein
LEIALPRKPWRELGLEISGPIETVQSRIEEIRKNHLYEGSFLAVSTILAQLAIGKSLNKLMKSESNVIWSDDFQTVEYLGMPVKLGKMRVMWIGLIQELQESLLVLAYGEPLPIIDLSKITDSTLSIGVFGNQGYCFIDHKDNQSQFKARKHRYEYLFDRVCKGKGQYQVVCTNAGNEFE